MRLLRRFNDSICRAGARRQDPLSEDNHTTHTGSAASDMQDVPDVLSPTQPTIAELIEVVIDQFALMGASPAQLDASRLRLRRDRNAYSHG